jgi:tetratricopeptide (TPR) repeat protein
MQRWFLSYNSRDFSLVDGLQNALKRKVPDAQIFFAPKTLRAGGYWLPMLAEGIAQANAFALVVGENGLGPWQVMEYYEALDRRVKSPDFPVVLVLLEGQPAPGLAFLRQLHWIMTPDPGSEATAARLVDAAAGGGSRPSELWRYTSPYRGLAAMTEADSDFFFGRQHETTEVLAALVQSANRLPVLLGNSGVGKSSLAQAGVLAALKRQALPGDGAASGAWPSAFHDSRRWCSLALKPGVEPIRALVEPFLDTWQFAATDPERASRQNGWIELLRDSKATLRDLLDATERRYQELNERKPPAFFIYVDQGEELYVRSEEAQRQRFSTLLAEGLADPRLHALMSMRSDFLGALQNDPPLYSVHEKIDVPPLREAALYEAVSRPAGLLSARFESEGLAADIAQRAAEESIRDAGALPLLSYLLDDMWTQMVKRGDGVLRLPPQAMELGGVLANRANAFLARYPNSEETLRRVLTLKLATVREDGEPTRRLARRSEFTDEEWRLVSELADHPHRLLVTITPEEGETYAEVAHEAIFRRWDKLRDWIAAEREFLVWKSKLEAARRTWEQSPESSRNDALLMGLALAQAQSWLTRRGVDLAKVDRDFIDLSIRREALERQQRESLRRRLFGTAIAALVVVSALAVFSFFQWRDAVGQKIEAIKQQHLAQQERDRAQHAVASFLLRLMTGLSGGDRAKADLDKAIKLNPDDTTSYILRAFLEYQHKDFDGEIADVSRVIEIDSKSVIAYLFRATAYEAKKDFDRAIGDYDTILKFDPQNSIVYNDRGFAYYSKQNYDRAIADYDRAIRLDPRYALAYNNRGNAFYAKKDYDRALADYSQAITLDPNNANSYFWYDNRANIYYNRRDYDRAIADYDEAVKHNPNYATAYNSRGNAYFGKGDYSRAEADYTAAIAAAPGDKAAAVWHWNRGNTYFNRRDYDRAIADYDEAVKINPDFAAAYNSRGNAYYAKASYDRAEADYTAAIKAAPGDKAASVWHWNRGNIYLKGRDYGRAIADYNEAVKINPDFAAAYNSRGFAHFLENEYDLAIADYDHAIRLNPRYAIAYANRGNAFYAKKDYDRALADYSEVIKIDPRNAAAYEQRGNTYLAKADFDSALADFTKAIAIDPKNGAAYNGRCWTRVAANRDLSLALKDCDAALRIRPNAAEVFDSRGFAYLRLGEFDKATADFDAALKIDAKLASSLYGRGLAKLKLGDQAGADADMAAAKAIRPGIAAQLARLGFK